jgi:hypothetical protein
MHPLACLLLSLVVAATRLATAADEPQAAPPTTFTTTVLGTVPDLTGRWLLVANVTPKGQQQGAIPITLGWDVTQRDGKPDLVVRWGGLPPGLKASYDAAVEQRAAWEPSEEQLREMRDSWETVASDHPPVGTFETTITGADAFTEELKSDEMTKNAKFVVQTVTNFTPGPDRPTRDAMVFGVTEPVGDGYRGNCAIVSVANAPFPIPISFMGTFRLYRLGPPPQPSLWKRVLGMFKGCGRTAS